MKSGFAGIIGRPNVGKSTLLNSIMGEKIAITTDKPQTTRNSIRAIYTEPDEAQIVFIDTPGIHKAQSRLGSAMTEMALNTFREADVVLFLVDGSVKKGPGDRYIFDMIKDLDTPKILVINKTDLADPSLYKALYDEYDETGVFTEIFGVSALHGRNVDRLVAEIKRLLPEGPMYFPKDMVTDRPERFLVSEIVREKILMYLKDEVPHGVAVEIESFKEEGSLVRIGAVIYCEKKSHKGIIIGRQGRKLKGIGQSARKEIEALLGAKVYLEIWVKVKENWRDSDAAIADFGYRDI